MAGTVEKKLAELGITLPTPATPVANYIPFTRVGSLLFVSGQICLDAGGKLVAKGKLGGGVSLEDSILRSWEELVDLGEASCPVCAGRMHAASRCEDCGSELS